MRLNSGSSNQSKIKKTRRKQSKNDYTSKMKSRNVDLLEVFTKIIDDRQLSLDNI
jgi:hypothetical protein